MKYNLNVGTGTSDRQVSYAYDAAGNRQSVTDTASYAGAALPFTANNVNQYTAIDGLNVPTYDAAGNTTSIQ